MNDSDTKQLLAAARCTARETQELVEQSREQINGIGQNLRLLSWCAEQMKLLLRSALYRKDRDGELNEEIAG